MDFKSSSTSSSLFRSYSIIDCLICSGKLWLNHLTSITFLTLILLLPSLVAIFLGASSSGYFILAIALLLADMTFNIGVACIESSQRFLSFAILKLLFSKKYFFKTLSLALLLLLFQWIGTLILTSVLFAMPAPFAWILGLTFGIFFIFCMIAISLAQSVWIWEGESGGNALARSFRLVKLHFGRAFEIQTILFLIKIGVSYVLLSIFVLSDFNQVDLRNEEFLALFSTSVPITLWFVHFLITPLNSIATILLYIHLREINHHMQEPAPNLHMRSQDIMQELLNQKPQESTPLTQKTPPDEEKRQNNISPEKETPEKEPSALQEPQIDKE